MHNTHVPLIEYYPVELVLLLLLYVWITKYCINNVYVAGLCIIYFYFVRYHIAFAILFLEAPKVPVSIYNCYHLTKQNLNLWIFAS